MERFKRNRRSILKLDSGFWVREYGNNWALEIDVSLARWFKQLLTEGTLKCSKLDSVKYDVVLQKSYKKRGWSKRGIPKKMMLKNLGLYDVSKQLNKYVELSE